MKQAWIVVCLLVVVASVGRSNGGQPVCSDIEKGDRVGCLSWWKWDVAESTCVARGCCYEDPFPGGSDGGPSERALPGELWCYYPTARSAIEEVYVVQGCHIDVGFLQTAPEIINLWFHHHFPLAASVGQQLAALNASDGAALHFTSPAWLVSLYLDCPQSYARQGVQCPNASAVATFVAAVQQGWITWYAYPFVTEVETMDASLFDFAVGLAHELDARFGLAPKTVFSQRDVPGLTRAAIPLLTARGVHTISVGVNGGSAPPNVPKAFVWRDPPSGQEVLALWLQGGYAGVQLPHDPFFVYTMVPNTSSVLVVDWRGDNAGPPPSADSVLQTWRWLAVEFPHARRIVASTFDGYAATLSLADVRASLPVVEAEIGDTWIYGIASDPVKLARYQLATRMRSQCLADGRCALADHHVWQFSRLLLKAAEHTWGLDQKVAIRPYVASNWSNADLRALLPQPAFVAFVAEWHRQRRMAIEDALEALYPHPLYFDIVKAMAVQLTVPPCPPVPADWTPLLPAQLPATFPLPGGAAIGFDPATGAVNYLLVNGVRYAAAASPLALLHYSTYDEADYRRYAEHYNYFWPFTVDKYDQLKLNIDQSGAKHRNLSPRLLSVAVSPAATAFAVQLQFPADVVQLAGAPPVVYLIVDAATPQRINITVYVYNKTATRLPEALFLRFLPVCNRSSSPLWTMEKLSEWLDPTDVLTGGSKHMHAVSAGGLSYCAGQLNITAAQSPLVSFGRPSAFPTPLDQQPDWSQGVSFVLFNNLWNTNYIQWSIDSDFVFRYQLAF